MDIIYTAIFGDYDVLQEPEIITKGVIYICFTDKELKSNTWKIIHVDAKYDSVRQARHCKIMFHEYIKDFNIAMWIDANQQLKVDVGFLLHALKQPLILLNHPDRNCIYDEARECQRLKKDNWNIISAQMNCYHNDGYPKDMGLVATGLMIRKNDTFVNELCKQWFSEVFLKSYRDQLSFNYVYYNLKVKPSLALLPFEMLNEIATRWKHKTTTR